MKLPFLILAAGFLMLGGCTVVDVAEVVSYKARNAAKEKTPFDLQKEAIYERMKRYGINRDDVAALRRLYETNAGGSFSVSAAHVSVATDDLLKPGEHYRIEMDEHILTMKVPTAGNAVPGQWIWPYTNTRTPDPGMAKLLKLEKGAVAVANLGWYVCNGLLTGVVGRCDIAGVGMNYRVLTPKEIEDLSTPERMRAFFTRFQKSQIPTQEDIERSARERLIDNRMGTRIVSPPETVVINGRIWIRYITDRGQKRHYQYVTLLGPDRRLILNTGLPPYDYTAHPAPSTWPAPSKRALAIMEETVGSLRIAKINDDGAPDPFVVERVEPAPLPIRERATEPAPSYGIGDHSAALKGSARFTDNVNGTITDNLTGLIWLKDANCFGAQPWRTALKSIQTLAAGDCGLTDGSVAGQWQLPSQKELHSLIDYSVSRPTLLAGHPFTNVQAKPYWSSSAYDYTKAWRVDFVKGYAISEFRSSNYNIWPVLKTTKKARMLSQEPRFADNTDGTVTDNHTGLIWLKNANCFGIMSLSSGFLRVEKLASGACGLTDGSAAGQWRLPNLDELHQLVDLSAPQQTLSLSAGYPFSNVQAKPYWSSTQDISSANTVSVVDVINADSDRIYTNTTQRDVYTWPVRRGGDVARLPADQ